MENKLVPCRLEQAAANSLIKLLNSSVKAMDQYIVDNSSVKPSNNVNPIPTTNPPKEGANQFNQNQYPAPSNSHNFQNAGINFRASAKTAMKVLDIRRYLSGVVSKELAPILTKNSISRAVNDGNVSLLRLTIPSNAEVLDFRVLEYWCIRPAVPSTSIKTLKPRSRNKQKEIIHSSTPIWNPPDEFDWFSWDRMGKIISTSEACELFSIIKMTQCTLTLKELMVNATRPEYWTCSPNEMPVIAEAFLQMKLLTKLILRGMADDHLLKLIGQTASGLKHLDVSCSKFVTDKGIQYLFFNEELNEKASALCLIPSWMQKNLTKMQPLVNTICFLDLSWTNITSLARKMVNLIPGSFMFKRHFTANENEAYGHHLFVRKTPELSMTIRLKDLENKFEAEIHPFAGKNGTIHFLKFVENHAWKGCNLFIFTKPPDAGNGNPGEDDKSNYIGLITPSKEEKRIQGLVTFGSGNMIELYSIFPINLNLLGLGSPKIQILRGIVTDTWKQKGYLLQGLTDVEIFCEPQTILSVITSSPNLKRVRVRIQKKPLTDQPLLQALTSSMSTRTLEEFWIAPGSFKKTTGFQSEKNSQPATPGFPHLSTSIITNGLPNVEKSSNAYNGVPIPGEKYPPNSGVKNFHAGLEEGSLDKDQRVEDLVQLSVSCARRVITDCKKLRRLGNLSWWWITDEQLESLVKEIVANNSDLNILWDNLVMPGGCVLEDGSVVTR